MLVLKPSYIVAWLVPVLLSAVLGLRVQAQHNASLDPAKALTQYHLDTWATEDGLPQGSITTILQTHDGYLWLGTQEGLVRFDGLRFELFDKRSGALPKNLISGLFEDPEGALWIGTRGGGLIRYAQGRFEPHTTEDGLPSDDIGALEPGRDGTLWIGFYFDGVARLDSSGISHFSQTHLPEIKEVNTLYEDREGALWIAVREGGLVRHHAGTTTTFSTDDGLRQDDLTAILRTRDGTLWVGSRSEGLHRFDGQRFQHYGPEQGLPEGGIRKLYEDHAGHLWAGTDSGGICRMQQDRFTCLSAAQGLTHDTILSIFEDREGSLWVGTDGGGLNRLKDGKFVNYTTTEGLAHDFIFSVYEDAAGALWVGTEGGGVSRLKDGAFTTYTTDDGLADDKVLSIYSTRDGSVWFGTRFDGLSRFKDGRFTTYTADDGLPNNGVWALFADSKDNLWIATTAGLGRYHDGAFSSYTTEDGLASNIITAFAEDPDGALWVGTYEGGLQRLTDAGAGEVYTIEDNSNFVLAIHADAEGTVWFSTREGGLHRLRDGQVQSFYTQDGLYNDTILQILEDGRGHLWMSSSRGIFVLAKADLDAFARGETVRLTPRIYDRSDGLRTHEFMGGTQPAGWKGADGRMWFPTVGAGLTSINPERTLRNDLPPPVLIESARANDTPIPLGGEVQLAPGHDKFEFHYAGLSLLAPEKVRYRYRLDGVEEEWVDAGSRREAFYTNLEPGAYTFHVLAQNNDGVWSEQAASVSFYLKPYFHQTPWFYLLCVLGLIVLGAVAYRMRIGHLKRREFELVQLVEARTVDLREEKEKTEQALRQTEEARYEAERQKQIVEEAKAVIEAQAGKLQEMDRIKTRFFNNISHEFRTPLTLNIGPLENALMGVYGPVSAEMRTRLEVMLRNSRLLLRLINQLLDVSKLESGQMELKVREGNLVELLEGVLFSFTAFIERKNLTLDFQPEAAEFLLKYDPGHMEKVFFNLLSNAVKFTPEGGRIAVAIGAGEPDAHGIEGETVEIRFTDTGPGIPEADLPYIFDRFHQVDGTISKVQEGTGIGLSLVKELVELHGGAIQVESTPGAGATFVVTLPVKSPHLEAYAAEGDGAAKDLDAISRGPMVEMAVFEDDEALRTINGNGNGHGPPLPSDAPTVLVVDDNPEIREYVAGCLRQHYHVVKAFDGRDALGKARQLRPALLVSDVMMPNMNGYELCRAIKQDEGLAHTPVILLTSRATLDEKIQGLESGADDYLTKPFSAKELQVRARNLLHLGLQQKALQKLNEELRHTNEELREVSQMKSQLLRIAAHDLKNPLNGIREFAKILKGEVAASAPGQEMLDLIHTSSDQMLSMVGKLLDSEALESGELVLSIEPVSLSKIAEEVVRRNRPQAQRKDETLILHLDENDLCLVEGSWEWLRDAVDNLISNAIKYSPLGKTIWVSVKRHEGVVRFAVRDEGPGLTGEDKKKLFGKFQRLSAVPTSNESSTGLGLSIVKQIVDMHHGRVWAESEPGKGSTFIIELDALAAASPTPGESAPPASRDTRKGIPPNHDRWSAPSADNGFPAESE